MRCRPPRVGCRAIPHPLIFGCGWANLWRASLQVQGQAPLHGPPYQVDQGSLVPCVGPGQNVVVLAAVGAQDDGRRLPFADQQQIHDQPGGPAVAVDEGMNGDQPVMGQGGAFDRVQFQRRTV